MSNATMTRRHFEALAEGLIGSKPYPPELKGGQVDKIKFQSELAQWRADVCAIANVCELTNDRFDRRRFYERCGFDDYR